jgi:aspartyl-tRNA(Asn)/glutamyl-tRNA(Gln) amidotransferase subunit B
MEEDAGKSLHMGTSSWVDFNRTGVPLLEIVSEPDIRSSQESVLYLKKIKQILQYGGISDCNMEEGSLRCDANVSIRPKGETKLGTRVEIKNINSFRFVQKAIDFEVERQIAVVKEGGRVIQETRQYDSNTGVTKPMRSKEDAHDYRYFPEPDLMFNLITEEEIEKIRETLPETPDEKCERFGKQYGLPLYDASVLTADLSTAHFFEEGVKNCKNPKMLSNWIMAELMREWNVLKCSPHQSPVSAVNLAGLVNLIEEGKISGKIAKDIFPEMIKTGKPAAQIVQEKGLLVISNVSEIEELITCVLKDNEKSVQDFKSSNKNAFGFLVGQIMKASQGKADPKIVNELLKKKLETK